MWPAAIDNPAPQTRTVTENNHHNIQAKPARRLKDHTDSSNCERLYGGTLETPSYLEIEEIPKQSATMNVHIDDNLDEIDYLTTDFTDNERYQVRTEIDEQKIRPSRVTLAHNIKKVQQSEDFPTFVDNSVCNMSKSTGYLSPATLKSVTGNTPQSIPPPLPAERPPSEMLYEKIPDALQDARYLQMEEIPTQVSQVSRQTPATQTPNTTATTGKTRVTCGRKVSLVVVIGLLTCINSALIVMIITSSSTASPHKDSIGWQQIGKLIACSLFIGLNQMYSEATRLDSYYIRNFSIVQTYSNAIIHN